jgi:hypothetical protein
MELKNALAWASSTRLLNSRLSEGIILKSDNCVFIIEVNNDNVDEKV